MSDVVITESYLEDIADAIRDRNGTNQKYKIHEMDEAIENLSVIKPATWVRPSDWPDYSQVDLTEDDEIIYLTYDCTYGNKWISILVSGAYIVDRGSLNNGIFTSVNTVNCTSGYTFQESLPTNEGNYVVYRITPQEGAHITNFRFVSITDINSSYVYYGPFQPCVERYCSMPNNTTAWGNSQGTSSSSHITSFMKADTIIGAKPSGSIANSYRTDSQGLLYVNISECSFANVTSLQNMFYQQNALHEIYLPNDLGTKCINLNAVFQNAVERIVTLDLTGWDTSKVTNFSGTFDGCINLCEIKGIEDFDFTSATTMSGMFKTCRNINFDTSKWETSASLTNVSNLFYDCYNLVKIDLSGFNTTNVTDFNSMFNNCKRLVEIDLSNISVTNKATSLGSMFSTCRNLQKIIRTKNWDTSNVTNFSNMFYNCHNLKEVDISDFNFSKATNIKQMFMGDCSLYKIKANINLSALTAVANIAQFSQANWALEDISELIFTNCKFMPYFGYCKSLKTIKLPSSVTTIPNDTFRDCHHLTLVDCRDFTSVPTLSGANAFILNTNTKLKIVVPDDLYNTWITTANWSNATLVTRIISASDYEASLSS